MKRTLALLVVVALAGCGGGGEGAPTKQDFKKDFAPLDTQLKAAGAEMGKVFQESGQKTDAELTKEITTVGTHLGAVHSKMADLEAPDEIKSEYAKLNTILDGLEKDLSTLATAVNGHDAEGSRKGAQQIIRDSVKVKAVANRVRSAVGLKPTP